MRIKINVKKTDYDYGIKKNRVAIFNFIKVVNEKSFLILKKKIKYVNP